MQRKKERCRSCIFNCLYLIIIFHKFPILARRNTEEMIPGGGGGPPPPANSSLPANHANNDLRKRDKPSPKRTKSELEKWNAALGPYPVVSPGTREASFVHAISSAGVAHAVTRSCSSGELENCGCDRSLRGMSPEGFQVNSRFKE